MKRIKRIIGSAAFLIIGVFLLAAVSYLLRPVDDKSRSDNFYRAGLPGFYAEEDESLDIVSFGASGLSYFLNGCILWEEYGMTGYNLATSNQSIFALEALVDEVQKTQSPDLYIVETRKFLKAEDKYLNEGSFQYLYNNMKYSLNRISLINYLEDSWIDRFENYFDIILYHDSWEDFSYDNLQYIDNAAANDTKGWKTKKKIKKINFPEIVPLEEIDEIPVPDAAEEVLRSFITKCKEENLQVLFLATPWTIGTESQGMNKYMARIIEEMGYQFLDCNLYREEMGLDSKTDYWDRRHTNVLGAEKVTRFIGNYIQNNYDVSTEHSESVTSSWNAAAEKNRVLRDELKIKLLNK